MTTPHTTRCTLGPPHPRTGDLPLYGPDGPDGPTLGIVVATNPRAAGDARLWARAWRIAKACRAWVDWMDSPGDGTDKTLEEEEAMMQEMRDSLDAIADETPTADLDGQA